MRDKLGMATPVSRPFLHKDVCEVSKRFTIPPNDKTRLQRVPVLMLEKVLFAAESWPAFDAFAVVSFPV
jgi:hypothetical protein